MPAAAGIIFLPCDKLSVNARFALANGAAISMIPTLINEPKNPREGVLLRRGSASRGCTPDGSA
jgi:hypothetical protein